MQKRDDKVQRINMPQINNSHDYLNFVKKHHKSNPKQKNLMAFSSVLEINNNSRNVFGVNINRYESFNDKNVSLNRKIPHQASNNHYHIAYNTSETAGIRKEKLQELIEKKNREINDQIGKQRQKMSDIIYNFSKFRSMEQNYYKVEKFQDVKRKNQKYSIQKNMQNLKFPQLMKPANEIFTINYDNEGKQIIKMSLEQIQINSLKKKSSSLILDKDIREQSSLREYSKRQQIIKKKKQQQLQFGIQIKSIKNSMPLQQLSLSQNGLKIKNPIQQFMFSKNSLKYNKIRDESSQVYLYNKKIKKQTYQLNVSQGQSDQNGNPKIDSLLFIADHQVYTENMQKSEFLGEELMEESVRKVVNKQKGGQNVGKKQKKHLFSVGVDKQMTLYDIKISLYRQFLFMLNLCHNKFDPLILKDSYAFKTQQKYKYFVGRGNNSLLVKSIFKRRFWWIQEQDYKKCNCVWTQLKIIPFFQLQNKNTQKYQYKSEDNTNSFYQAQKKKKFLKNREEPKVISKGVYKAPLPGNKDKIFTFYDKKMYQSYQNNMTTNDLIQRNLKFSNRLKYFEPKVLSYRKQERNAERMHNHVEFNHFIGNKKALFYNLKTYYNLLGKNVFQIIPLTFHIKGNSNDNQYQHFINEFKKIEHMKFLNKKKKEAQGQKKKKKIKNIWIIKPGELSNRGNGIVVINQLSSFNNILKMKEKHNDGNQKTYIVQKYIENPLLYKGRKFDIRHYMIITKLHGILRAYWYGEGYIRTSSYQFDLQDVGDEMIHLTNDAIQKNSTFYGKHEEGNKLSYSEFQKYLDGKYGQGKYTFSQHFYPKMKAIAADAIKSCFHKLDPNNFQHNFEIFGLDFMIDEDFNVWLIQVNTNPCLQLSSKLLARIIPNMLEQAFRLSVDMIFPPPSHYPNSLKYSVPDHPLDKLMYELIFDSARDGKQLTQLFKNSEQIDYGGQIKEDDETYQNQGKQMELNIDI